MMRFLLILFLFSSLLVRAQFSRMQNGLTMDYSMHPASLFFDKGTGVQVNFIQQATLGNENSAAKPYELSANFKYLFPGLLKQKKVLKKSSFPGFSIGVSNYSNGGLFQGLSMQGMFGYRFKISQSNDVNDFVSLTSSIFIRRETMRDVSSSDFFLVDSNDPVFRLSNSNAYYYGVFRLSSFLNKRLNEETVLQVGTTWNNQLDAGKFGEMESVALLMKVGWLAGAAKDFQLGWQQYTLASAGLGLQFRPAQGMRLYPQCDIPIVINEKQQLGLREITAWRLGLILAMNVGKVNSLDGIQLSIKGEIGKRDNKNEMRQKRSEFGFSHFQPVGPLIYASNATILSASLNSENLPDECNIQRKIVESECADLTGDIEKCKACLSLIESVHANYPCSLTEDQNARKINDIENEAKSEFNRLNFKISTVNIDGVKWANQNLNIEMGKFASTMDEWIELCASGQPAYCYINFDPSNKAKGLIYNKHAAANFNQLIKSNRYRVANQNDWKQMLTALDRQPFDAKNDVKASIKTKVICLLGSTSTAGTRCSGINQNGFNYTHENYLDGGAKSFKSKDGEHGGYWIISDNNEVFPCLFHSSVFKLETSDINSESANLFGFFIRVIDQE